MSLYEKTDTGDEEEGRRGPPTGASQHSSDSLYYTSLSAKSWAVSTEGLDFEEGIADDTTGLRFCKRMYLDYRYWVLHTAFIFIEPILCSLDTPSRPGVRIAEIIIIALCTLLLWVQLDVLLVRAYRELTAKKTWPSTASNPFNAARGFLDVLLAGKVSEQTVGVVVEASCLLCGWAFVFHMPGVAVLRCFRLARVLFYADDLPQSLRAGAGGIDDLLASALAYRGLLFSRRNAERMVRLVYKVTRFGGYILQNMGREIVILDRKTKGGFILMAIFFFSGWVMGAVSWIDQGLNAATLKQQYAANNNTGPLPDVQTCDAKADCLGSVYRLSLWDSTGFDFLWSLRHSGDRFLFAVLVVFMCGTSFGVLNGLTGVFRKLITKASRRAFVANSEGDESATKRVHRDFLGRREVILRVAQGIGALQARVEALAAEAEELCARRAPARLAGGLGNVYTMPKADSLQDAGDTQAPGTPPPVLEMDAPQDRPDVLDTGKLNLDERRTGMGDEEAAADATHSQPEALEILTALSAQPFSDSESSTGPDSGGSSAASAGSPQTPTI